MIYRYGDCELHVAGALLLLVVTLFGGIVVFHVDRYVAVVPFIHNHTEVDGLGQHGIALLLANPELLGVHRARVAQAALLRGYDLIAIGIVLTGESLPVVAAGGRELSAVVDTHTAETEVEVVGRIVRASLDHPVEGIIVGLDGIRIDLGHEQVVEKFQTVGTVGVDTERVEIFRSMYQRGATVSIDRGGESDRIATVFIRDHIVDTSCQCATHDQPYGEEQSGVIIAILSLIIAIKKG